MAIKNPLLNKLFVDSSVLISFIDRSHPNHHRATSLLQRLATTNKYLLYTSIYNISELVTTISYEMNPSLAIDFLGIMLKSNIEIIYPQQSDLIVMHKIMLGNFNRQISFKEASNATLMQRQKISQIITFTAWNNLFGTNVSAFSL